MASFIPKEGAPEDVLYPKDVLRSISAGRGYYFTDSHWSVPGKAAIALLIAERAALPDVVIRNGLATLTAAMNGPSTPRFSGDLGRKFTPNRCEAAVSFVLKYNVAIYENGLEHIGGIEYNEGRLTVSISDHSTAADATLLIFGDSYLQQVAVYLGAFFKTVVFCRTRFIHEEMVAMIRPHIIVTENAERYLNSVESDTSAPAFLLMPYLMERKPIFEIGATRAIAAILRSNREV